MTHQSLADLLWQLNGNRLTAIVRQRIAHPLSAGAPIRAFGGKKSFTSRATP
jgi:hypothetical protein